MSSPPVFIDTGGWYSLLVSNDIFHLNSLALLKELQGNARPLITTDYVLDEAATLLKARQVKQQAGVLFELVQSSSFIRMEWIAPDRFIAAQRLFLKHLDHGYSFTDCTSFAVMKELRIQDAVTADKHFQEAGFNVLLTL